MNDFTKTGLDRRMVVKGAAWSVPVLAAAVATPLAAASVGNASLDWTGNAGSLASLRILNGGSVATVGLLMTMPNQFTITNGTGAINATATVTVVVGRPDGVNIPVGQAYGFGVATLNGIDVASQNSTNYQIAPIVATPYGFPVTTFTGTMPVSVGSGGVLNVPIEFGLSGISTGVAISLLTTFPVTLTVDFGGGNSYSATTSIIIPANAGIL